jgi:hypothetical protein
MLRRDGPNRDAKKVYLQHIMRTNPEKGAEFAAQLENDENGPLIDIERVVDIFMSENMSQPATSFLLDALKDNKTICGLEELNVIHAPQVVDAILFLGSEMSIVQELPICARRQAYCNACVKLRIFLSCFK